jgi:hypothetical protein
MHYFIHAIHHHHRLHSRARDASSSTRPFVRPFDRSFVRPTRAMRRALALATTTTTTTIGTGKVFFQTTTVPVVVASARTDRAMRRASTLCVRVSVSSSRSSRRSRLASRVDANRFVSLLTLVLVFRRRRQDEDIRRERVVRVNRRRGRRAPRVVHIIIARD